VLLDLGILQEERDKEKQEAWCQDSIKKLREKAGPQVIANETPSMNGKKRKKNREATKFILCHLHGMHSTILGNILSPIYLKDKYSVSLGTDIFDKLAVEANYFRPTIQTFMVCSVTHC
jgi:hypothetical protein